MPSPSTRLQGFVFGERGGFMWGKKVEPRFDAGAWRGQVDLTRAVVTFSMVIGLGVLWLSIAFLIMIQI